MNTDAINHTQAEQAIRAVFEAAKHPLERMGMRNRIRANCEALFPARGMTWTRVSELLGKSRRSTGHEYLRKLNPHKVGELATILNVSPIILLADPGSVTPASPLLPEGSDAFIRGMIERGDVWGCPTRRHLEIVRAMDAQGAAQ